MKRGYSAESNKTVRKFILDNLGYTSDDENYNKAVLSFTNDVKKRMEYAKQGGYWYYYPAGAVEILMINLSDYFCNELAFLVSLGYPEVNSRGKEFTEDEIHKKYMNVLTREGYKLYNQGLKLMQ